MLVWSLSKN